MTDVEIVRDVGFDLVQELAELGRAVAGITFADDCPVLRRDVSVFSFTRSSSSNSNAGKRRPPASAPSALLWSR
jgi:hypothetical protein